VHNHRSLGLLVLLRVQDLRPAQCADALGVRAPLAVRSLRLVQRALACLALGADPAATHSGSSASLPATATTPCQSPDTQRPRVCRGGGGHPPRPLQQQLVDVELAPAAALLPAAILPLVRAGELRARGCRQHALEAHKPCRRDSAGAPAAHRLPALLLGALRARHPQARARSDQARQLPPRVWEPRRRAPSLCQAHREEHGRASVPSAGHTRRQHSAARRTGTEWDTDASRRHTQIILSQRLSAAFLLQAPCRTGNTLLTPFTVCYQLPGFPPVPSSRP